MPEGDDFAARNVPHVLIDAFRDPAQYRIAGILIAIGILLWAVTVAINRATGVKPADPLMSEIGGDGPKN